MSIKTQATLLAAAASISVATPPAASAQGAQAFDNPIAVAVVDVNVARIDHADPNVRIVQLNQGAMSKFVDPHVNANGVYSHGDMVASSFVREYRKLEPNRPIIIYAVNPFKETNGQSSLNMNLVRSAMPALQAANVRIAVTAFGVESKEGGDMFLKPFKDANIVVFAAAPNEQYDPGIYPAASKDTISVATEDREGYFDSNPRAGKWIDVTINGFHEATSGNDVNGTSFAVAHAAAYGAYAIDREPSIGTEGVRAKLAAAGTHLGHKMTVRIGTKDMIDRFKAAGQPEDMDLGVMAAYMARGGRSR